MFSPLIGERSDPLSDKLGGKICIAKRALVCIYLSLVPRPSYHGVPFSGPGNNSPRLRLIKTARYA